MDLEEKTHPMNEDLEVMNPDDLKFRKFSLMLAQKNLEDIKRAQNHQKIKRVDHVMNKKPKMTQIKRLFEMNQIGDYS